HRLTRGRRFWLALARSRIGSGRRARRARRAHGHRYGGDAARTGSASRDVGRGAARGGGCPAARTVGRLVVNASLVPPRFDAWLRVLAALGGTLPVALFASAAL